MGENFRKLEEKCYCPLLHKNLGSKYSKKSPAKVSAYSNAHNFVPIAVTPTSRAVAIAVPIVVTLLLVGVCVLAIVLFCIIYIRIRIQKYMDLFVF